MIKIEEKRSTNELKGAHKIDRQTRLDRQTSEHKFL